MLRCVAGLLALVLMVGSVVEPALGLLRDGAVHHESAASAATHADRTLGEHGHEDGLPFHHQHGREHQHGTGADHCMHQHGLAFVSADRPALPIVSSIDREPVTEHVTPVMRLPLDFFHPPRV